MHLDNHQLALLERFAKTPEGQMVVQVMTERLTATDKDLRSLTGEALFRAQGKAQELDQMLAYFRGVKPPRQIVNTRSQGSHHDLRN